MALPDLIGPNQLDVGFGETVESIHSVGDDIVVDTNRLSYRTRAVLVADRRAADRWSDRRCADRRPYKETQTYVRRVLSFYQANLGKN